MLLPTGGRIQDLSRGKAIGERNVMLNKSEHPKYEGDWEDTADELRHAFLFTRFLFDSRVCLRSPHPEMSERLAMRALEALDEIKVYLLDSTAQLVWCALHDLVKAYAWMRDQEIRNGYTYIEFLESYFHISLQQRTRKELIQDQRSEMIKEREGEREGDSYVNPIRVASA